MEEPADREDLDRSNDASLDHWSKAQDPRTIARWRRRILYKQLAWRFTFGLAETLKRGLDILGSVFALFIFAPVFLVTSILIKLEDRGPIYFKQMRVGRGGKLFAMIKFRSMVVNADKMKDALMSQNQHGGQAVTFKMKGDPRVTRIGALIRKYSIDEFPQFFNVLLGDMSLVGPRPSLPREVSKYKAWHLRRLKVKPGITCLWQIGGRGDINFEGQVRLDLQYIASQSLWGDIVILLKTIPAVIAGKGAY
jgi:lipopolysaccharide/colanic/teichoic acid biosynthesis glycosyltransferase